MIQLPSSRKTMKDPLNKGLDYYIDYRLRTWGYWYAKVLTHGLGYPSKSIEARMKDDGGVLSKSTAPIALPVNPEAEEIDGLIVKMGNRYPALADAVRVQYTNSDVKAVLKKLNISHTTHKTNLRIAKILLIEKLDK